MADDGAGGFSAGRGFGAKPKRRVGLIQPDAVPRGPGRSLGARKTWVVFGNAVLSLLLLAVIGGGTAAYLGHARLISPGPLVQEATVTIPRNSGTGEVADALERAGVIDSPMFFQAATRLTRSSQELKAGEYVFRPGVSMKEVLDTLIEGRAVQHAITLPEGWTSQMIVDRINADTVMSGDPVTAPAEGTLLPDTYNVERATTRAQLLARMQAEQKKVLDEIWTRGQPRLPVRSEADLVTLASVVEKETGRADERSRVAGVFLNRLARNMRLQSDPTVIYGMVAGRGRLDRPLTRADLDAQTPYNTYTNPGLPAGPIANPGRASLEAVASPSQTNDLYFVADGTGGHAFAATLQEHNQNVARWRALQPAKPAGTEADVPPSTEGASGSPSVAAPGSAMPGVAPSGAPANHAYADPVADTKLDPLLDKTYDLNSAQTVPKVGALGDADVMPPTASGSASTSANATVPDLRLDDGTAKPVGKTKSADGGEPAHKKAKPVKSKAGRRPARSLDDGSGKPPAEPAGAQTAAPAQ